MTLGMVGFAGIGAITKKLGGYTNTKVKMKDGLFVGVILPSLLQARILLTQF